MTGFENHSKETLLKIRANLLKGLDEVAKTIENGTFKKVGEKGSAPASQSGHLTLALLEGIEAELKTRK